MRPKTLRLSGLMLVVLLASGCLTSGPENHTLLQEGENQTTTHTKFPEQPEIQKTPNETYENPEYLKLYFVNESCYLEGEFFLNEHFIKKTANTILTLYWEDVAGYVNKSGEDVICLKGYLPPCFSEYAGWNFKGCWYINLSETYFVGIDVNASADINPRDPIYPFEMLNFVKPAQVKSYIEHWRDILVFNNDTEHDLEVIWNYVNTIFQYRDDMLVMGVADYWRTPNETIDSWGDCEDWTNTFVSLALAYNSSLKCYSVLLPEHLTTFCKFPKDDNSYEYDFFDKDTNPHRVISKFDSDKENKLRELLEWYSSDYGAYGDITAVFNDKQYFEFENNDGFIKWALYSV